MYRNDDLVDVENKVFNNSINLLENVLRLSIPPTLKSVYSIKLRSLKTRLGQVKFNSLNGQCSQCFINLLDGPASFRFETAKKQSKFARRILRKSDGLTKYQETNYKRLKKQHQTNKLVIKCKFCKKVYCIKPPVPVKTKTVEPPKSEPPQNKKKKKNKDKYCGLNKNVVNLNKKNKKKKVQPINEDVIDLTTPSPKKAKTKMQNKNTVITGKIAKNNEKRKKEKNKNALNKLNNLLKNPNAKKDVASLKHFLSNL